MNKAAVIATMGLATDATDAQVEQAIATMKAAKDQAIADLKTEREKVGKERAEMLVDNAITAKKIPAGKRDAWVTNATLNYDSVKELLDGIPAPTQATNQVVPDSNQEAPTNSAGTGVADDRSKWTAKDYMEKAPADLQMMAEKEPDKYRALVSNAYPTVGKR